MCLFIYIPRVFKLTPWSGTLTQYASSLLKHCVIASTALVMAISIPLSLTKKVVPYLADNLVQKTFGRANLTPSPTLKLRTFPRPPN
jgi:hypothetical protein